MAKTTIKTNLTLNEIRRIIRDLPGVIAGTKPDLKGIRRAYWSGMAYSMYGDIEKAFNAKSDLKSDELGDRWQDLSPERKAQRAARFGELNWKEFRNLKNPRTKGILSPELTKIWNAVYRRQRNRLIWRERLSSKAANIQAAKMAWGYVKKLGGRSKIQALGNRKIPVLKDKGKLALSLKQGKFDGVNYTPPTRNQIFTIKREGLELGSREKKASKHHRGIPARNLPQRRLWPANVAPWVKRGNQQGVQAVLMLLSRAL